MTRLNNYLTEIKEIRSKMLTEQEAIDIINKNCSDILNKYKKHPDWKIYRGLELSPSYIFTDPSKGLPRYSRGNIENYYTLLIDNLPNWKKYPKRSRSIICTNSIQEAESYGDVYIVFPFNNANFGVCSKSDVWISFLSTIGNLRIFVNNLNKVLKATTQLINYDKDWKTLTKAFKISEDNIKNNNFNYNTLSQMKIKWVDELLIGNSYLNIFKKYMDPNKNNFGLTKDPTNITKNREIWTDSKCVLVYEELVDKII